MAQEANRRVQQLEREKQELAQKATQHVQSEKAAVQNQAEQIVTKKLQALENQAKTFVSQKEHDYAKAQQDFHFQYQQLQSKAESDLAHLQGQLEEQRNAKDLRAQQNYQREKIRRRSSSVGKKFMMHFLGHRDSNCEVRYFSFISTFWSIQNQHWHGGKWRMLSDKSDLIWKIISEKF